MKKTSTSELENAGILSMLRWIVDVAFRLWDTAVTIVYYASALVGALVLSVFLLEFSFRNDPLPEEKLTLELYPYDGFHNRADHVKAAIPRLRVALWRAGLPE
jgi:hypothetical protein